MSITEDFFGAIQDIARNIWMYIITSSVWDLIDILIVTVIVFFILQLLRKTNAFSVLKGVLILLALMWLSELLKMRALNFLLSSLLQVGLLAIVILFQPELRKMLEQMGSRSITGIVPRPNETDLEKCITQTVDACRVLSWERQGALIVFERRVLLDSIAKTGTIIDASMTAELLKNIFWPKAPLHDGAVIAREGRIAGAGCMLPLTTNNNLSKDLGMRHRAGIGMSENSDAVVVIVSEETGSISVATGGMLKRHLTPETLEKLLRMELLPSDEQTPKKGLAGLIQRVKGLGKKDD